MIGIIGFLAGVSVTGIVWYVKDYCMDSLYCKGYARGYRKAVEEAGDGLHDGLVEGLREGRRELDIDEL